jgi:1-aminocyclopropane-1-carboxylate deaminase/D-cysteine desulfhydrase-like pyridoxal-dependent ACC family enzyme
MSIYRLHPRLPKMPDQGNEPLTPIEAVHGLWVKRDDRFQIAGICGGKVRACARLIRLATSGVVTASARQSPQAQIVARLAHYFGLPCRIHTASGEETPELLDAAEHGAEIVRHRAGYTSVINARARADCYNRQWTLVPFGMESEATVQATRYQVGNLPMNARRLVVPVGSGMTLAGILHGLQDRNCASARGPLPVVAVQVGADPIERLDRWAPTGWRHQVSFIKSPLAYHRESTQCDLHGIPLDPIYESKCLPFLEPGDCFWIVGRRRRGE